MLERSGQSILADGLSFFATAILWIADREPSARVERTDNARPALSLAMLCGIAILSAAVDVFHQPGWLTAGFEYHGRAMVVVCDIMSSTMRIDAAAQPHVMRPEVASIERWSERRDDHHSGNVPARAAARAVRMVWVLPKVAMVGLVVRRVIAPCRRAAKAVDSAA